MVFRRQRADFAFYALQMLFLLILILVPQITLTLPRLMGYIR